MARSSDTSSTAGHSGTSLGSVSRTHELRRAENRPVPQEASSISPGRWSDASDDWRYSRITHTILQTPYAIRLMGQVVGVRDARSPDDAVSDYLLAQGYAAGEFERVAPGALSWRGAVFSAEPVDGHGSGQDAARD